MIFVFYFFASVLVFLGYKSLRGGIEYLNFFKREIAEPRSDFTPFVSIIAPCRGLDKDLKANLSALFCQEYPNYEIVFVVDDKTDDSVKIIEEVSGKAVNSKLVVAGKATHSSQKVHNLRRAVLEASKRSEVFVFVDSDARLDAEWLRNLVAPLKDKNVGAATGYRWFIAKRGGFSSQLSSVWNASIASALGANVKSNFCWGGATAIRREMFEKLKISDQWRGVLSDDFAITRILQRENLPIRFVPQCLTATIEDYSFREFLEFSTRQMKITRVYAPHLWKAAFIGSFLFSATFWTGVLLLFFESGWHFRLTLFLLLTIFTLGAAKARLRLNAVKLILKNYEKQLNRSFFWQTLLWTITPIVFFYNCFSAWRSRKIVWRGIEYELVSPNETKIVNRHKTDF